MDPKGYRFNTMKLSEAKVPCTLTAQAHLYFHPTECRQITVAEMKRIQTFPDDFKFLNRNDARIRIGNSVPPNLIKNVANYIIEKTDNFKIR